MKKIIVQKGLFLDKIAYLEDDKLKKLKFINKKQDYFEKDIFLAKKKKQNISMSSVALSLDENMQGFMHYFDEENFDYMLCQIKKIYNNDKNPKLTNQITLIGKYIIYIKGSTGLTISGKSKNSSILEEFKDCIDSYILKDTKIILRSNFEIKDKENALKEIEEFNQTFENISNLAKITSKPKLLYRQYESEELFLSKLNTDIDELIINDKTIAKNLKNSRFNIEKITFDENSNLFETNLINTQISKLLSDKVNLDNNINLYIQKTEAMHVIDVNSAGYFKYKSSSKNAYHINSYVIPEIANQIILRDLSGIILIDFIEMKDEKLANKLIEKMQKCLEEDDRKATVVSITKLSLMQIIRKKEDLSLSENLISDTNIVLNSEDYIFEQINEKLKNMNSQKEEINISIPVFETTNSQKNIKILEEQYKIKIKPKYLKKEDFNIKIN